MNINKSEMSEVKLQRNSEVIESKSSDISHVVEEKTDIKIVNEK